MTAAQGKRGSATSSLKPMIRVAAFDDGCFVPRTKSETLLVGVIYRLDSRLEGIISTKIAVDGLDSTAKIISLLEKSRFLPQVRFILLDGVNFAGFNIVDIEKLSSSLARPVIVVFRRHPNLAKIRRALSHFNDSEARLKLIEKAGEIRNAGGVHFQFRGTDERTARQLIKKCLVHSNMPEPLRISHMIASGITRGESTRH